MLHTFLCAAQVFHVNPFHREALREIDQTNRQDQPSFPIGKNIGLAHPRNTKLLKLQWRKFDSLASKVGGAKNIFRQLFGNDKAKNTFWLDSSSVEKVFNISKDLH